MKKLLNTFALLLISLISCGQAATLINSQATPKDTTVTNFMYIGAGNRIYVAKQDSLKVRSFQMKWMKDTLSNRTAPYMKITVAADSMTQMRTRINTKLSKSDTSYHWKPLAWQPSWSQVTSKPSFSTVATSGQYSDLTGVPNMANYYLSSNPAGYISSVPAQTWTSITGKPSFATVATTGAYNDLSGRPTIPSVPTNISAFTNDVPYLTTVPAQSFASLTGKPTTLSGFGITDAYPLSGNPSNFLTSISSGQIATALGFTPYNSSNPANYLSSISSSNVTSALGYTPYNGALNPNGYISSYTETDPLFNTKFSSKSTTDLAEGTKLFYTDTRARASHSAGVGISYDNTTGVITNSAPDQTVSIASGTGISVTGTYPSFTVSGSSSAATFNNAPARTIGTSFQVSTTRPARVSYTVNATTTLSLLNLNSNAQAFLEISPNNSTWTTLVGSGNTKTLAVSISVGLNESNLFNLQAEVPAGYWVRLRAVTSGGGLISFSSGQEITY